MSCSVCFDFERSESEDISCFYLMKFAFQTILFKFVLDQAKRKRCTIDWNIYLLEQIWNSAYVVFMTVGYDHALDFFRVRDEISQIRYYQIDTKHLIFRERHTAVNNKYLILIFKNRQVLSDLIKTAYRYDLEILYFFPFYWLFFGFASNYRFGFLRFGYYRCFRFSSF